MTLHKLFCCVLLSSLLACSSHTEKETVAEINKSIPQEREELSETLQSFLHAHPVVLVLTDQGCVSCNRDIVQEASKLLPTYNLGIVLETSGRIYDISALVEQDVSDHVLSDFKRQLSKKYNSSNSFLLFPSSEDNSGEHSIIEITLANLEGFVPLVKEKIALWSSEGKR